MNTHLLNIYSKHNITFERGDGIYLYDTQGNEYIDALCGIGVTSLGHKHPAITKAISEQANTLLHVSNNYYTKPQSALAKKLCDMTGLHQAFFTNSGAEATEVVLKMAKKYGTEQGHPNPKIIVMDQAFHGRSYGAWSACCDHNTCHQYGPLLPGFIRVPFNDVNALYQAAEQNDDIVAILLEPVLGKGGLLSADIDYLQSVRKVCDMQNWLMICDEVQSGVGKTGKFFAYQHTDITPDVVYTAKGLANGIPIGAYIANKKASGILNNHDHGTTQGGNAFACQVALTNIETIENEHLLENAARIGQHMHDKFIKKLGHHHDVDLIQGKGLMIGIKLHSDVKPYVLKALENRVIVNAAGKHILRLLPPLIITEQQADEIIKRICACFD